MTHSRAAGRCTKYIEFIEIFFVRTTNIHLYVHHFIETDEDELECFRYWTSLIQLIQVKCERAHHRYSGEKYFVDGRVGKCLSDDHTSWQEMTTEVKMETISKIQICASYQCRHSIFLSQSCQQAIQRVWSCISVQDRNKYMVWFKTGRLQRLVMKIKNFVTNHASPFERSSIV